MRALVQRVSEASVAVDGEEMARIGTGLLVLLGVRRGDGPEQADRMARKLRALRVFADALPEEAEPLYERVRAALGAQGGVFGARMAVALVNEGPVTLLVEI